MATNLTSIALTAPSVDPDIDVDGSFLMTLTGGYSGGGGVTAHDFYWEFDQGTSTWITIPASGGDLGLYTNDTNPLTGKTTTDAETITIYGDVAGSFYIRGRGVRGVNTYYTTELLVTVNAVGGDLSIGSGGTLYEEVTVEDVRTMDIEAEPDPQINVYSEVDVDAELGVTVAVQDKTPYDIDVYDEPSVDAELGVTVDIEAEPDPQVNVFEDISVAGIDVTVSIPEVAEDIDISDVFSAVSVDDDNVTVAFDMKVTKGLSYAVLSLIDLGVTKAVSFAVLDKGNYITVDDDVSVDESVDLAYELVPYVFDGVSVDATNVTVDIEAAAGLEIDVYDEVSVEEDVVVDIVTVADLDIDVFSGVTIEENIGLAFELVPVVFDSVNVDEYTEFALELVPTVYDEITVVDEETVVVEEEGEPLAIDVFSPISVADKVPWYISVHDTKVTVTLSTELYIDVFDSPSIEEFIAFVHDRELVVFDAVGVAEDITFNEFIRYISVYDEITADEYVEIDYDLVIDVSEDVSLEEDITFSEFVRSVDVFDSVTIEEYNDQDFDLVIDVYDEITVEEYTDLAFELVIDVYDEVSAVDDPTVIVEVEGVYSVNVLDNVGVEDVPTVYVEVFAEVDIDLFDDISVDESIERVLISHVSTYDSILVEEDVTSYIYTGIYTVSVYTDVHVLEDVDLLCYQGILGVSVFDGITLDENVTVSTALAGIDLEDSVAVADEPTVELGTLTVTISVYEDITLDENVQGSVSDLNVDVSDVVNVAEYLDVPAFYLVIDGNILLIDEIVLVIPDMAIAPDLPETVVGLIEGTWDFEEILPEVEVDLKLGRIKVELLDES